MNTYDEKTGLEIESPDLEAGYVYPGRKKRRQGAGVGTRRGEPPSELVAHYFKEVENE